MVSGDVLTLSGDDVRILLDGREQEILAAAAAAYKAHGRGDSSLPRSLFLRFPADERNRIIALPAYLGDGFGIAGMKWISSFPANLEKGLNRASAVIILNSAHTGRPQAIMEGSVVSAKRTAASAALAASQLTAQAPRTVGIIGCGPINREVTRFLQAVWPELQKFYVFDVDAERAKQFSEKCGQLNVEAEVVPELTTVLREAELISFATTAGGPHVFSLSQCNPVSRFSTFRCEIFRRKRFSRATTWWTTWPMFALHRLPYIWRSSIPATRISFAARSPKFSKARRPRNKTRTH